MTSLDETLISHSQTHSHGNKTIVSTNPEQKSPRESIPVTEPEVPSFCCIVYLDKDNGTETRAHVANLPDASGNVIEATGSNEREALRKIVPLFKKIVTDFHRDDAPIPWIDPIPDPTANQQKRIIPVHL